MHLIQDKSKHFLELGYHVAMHKINNLNDKIQNKTKFLKVDSVAFSKTVNSRLNFLKMNADIAFQMTKIPSFINLGVNTIKDIQKDIVLNPFSEKANRLISRLDNKKFLQIGFACLALSITSLEFQHYQTSNSNSTFNFSFSFNDINPNPIQEGNQNITKIITETKFMHSIFHNKIDAFVGLLGITEGKSNKFYKDNLGIATGYGWNPTKNSKEFNTAVAEQIGLNHNQVKAIERISDNRKVQSVPESLKKVILTDKQIKKSAEVMMGYYETEFFNVMKVKAKEKNKDYQKALESYHQMPFNQQAVMVHMAYKVGTPNLLKYNIFFDKLFVYMDQPNQKNLDKVIYNFDYSYKTRKGERKHDSKVEVAHSSFFEDCSYEKTTKDSINKKIDSCRNLVSAGKSVIGFKS
jgi:GH24 family phage-related lysozyme (muramidase)